MDWTNEDGLVVSTDAIYTFDVWGNRNITANFVEDNSCYLTFNLNDSNGNGWSGNYLVLNFEDGSFQKLTVPYDMSVFSYALPIVDGSHVSLGWISGLYTEQCSFTVSYSNGNMICYGNELNNNYESEFDVDCMGMPVSTYTITAMASPIEGGTISGEGEYEVGSICTLTAMPNEGYTFTYWMENEQQVSTDAEYSFIVTSDNNFVARFCSNEPITFADANVKALCVANWDTNGDGELSYAEAATVTDLGTVFKSNYLITSFNELQYFIGLNSIGSYAFDHCTNLTTIKIPNSVKSICDYAFDMCRGLITIELPDSLTSIGDHAFYYAFPMSGQTSIDLPNSLISIGNSAFCVSGLTSIELPNSLTSIGDHAFDGSRLTSIEIPISITLIGGSVFASCRSLTSVELPNSLLSIGSSAFSYCSNLTSIEIPNSVTSISSSAFSYCSNLTSIEIPNSVTSISGSAFSGCSGLEQITVAANNPIYDSRGNCNAIIETETNTLIAGCKNTSIPNTILSIGSWAFEECYSLTSIEIPSSVTRIYSGAFRGCSGLMLISVLSQIPPYLDPNSHPFSGVYSSISVYVPCGSIETYQANNRWKYFTNIMGMCSGEVSVMISPSEGGTVTGAGDYVGGDVCVLTAMPNPGYSFGNWTENGFVVSRDSVFSFYAHPTTILAKFCSNNPIVFADANVKQLCVANWDSNGDGELSYAEAARVTSLGNVFSQQTNITSFDELQYFIGLTSIDGSAFYRCYNLASVEIPNAVLSIGRYAFNQCYNLTSVDIPNSVILIDEYAFGGCSSLTSIDIPDSVTSIGQSAFSGCSSLTILEVPNSVTTIGRSAFYGCSGLEQITVDRDNTTYDSRENCNAIIATETNNLIVGCKNTIIPNSVTTIGSYSFASCSSLISIEIPNSVISIGEYAFTYCSGLSSIISLADIPPTTSFYNPFYNVPTTISVYVPCGAVEIYQSANGWSGFTNIMEMCPGIVSVVASSAEGGTVTGGGSYEGGAICTLTATPNEGYLFSHWIKDGEVVSSDTIYDFKVIGDAVCVAEFLLLESPIGVGEETNVYLPSYSYYKYTLSQQIYTSDEIGVARNIGSISYFNGGETKTRSYDIYMVHTVKSVFENNTDWITVTENDRVYSGSVTMNSGCWTAITLDTSFDYNGTSNLAIIIDDNSGNWTNGPHMSCRVFNADGNQAIRVYSDNTNYNPYNPSTYNGTLHAEKNLIMLGSLEYNTSIVVSANPQEGGTVTGSGSYYVGAVCTITATANPGYHFLNWTEDGNVVSSDEEYSFTVMDDRNLVANFYTNHWMTSGSFQNNMFMIGVVQIDGVEQASATLELGAFCNGECRGSELPFEENGRWLYFMSIGGNNGEDITFRLYDHALQQELDLYCYNVLPLVGSDFIGLDNPYEVLFANIVNVSVDVNPEGAGTVSGAGEYVYGTTATLAATANEGYAFISWTSDGEIVSTEPSYTFTVTESVSLTANFDVVQSQQLTLGWNWFSTYLEITLDDLKAALLAAFPNVGANALVIKSKSGQTSWNPLAQRWVGSLNTIDLSQMYMIKVPTDIVITLQGVPINPADHPVTIKNGVNWIAFPSSESMSVTNAFAGFAVNGDMVKSKANGVAAYYGTIWAGALKNLVPGQGYIYKSNVQYDRTFTFPISTR